MLTIMTFFVYSWCI